MQSKKIYNKPTILVSDIDLNDVILSSGGTDLRDLLFGNGLGVDVGEGDDLGFND